MDPIFEAYLDALRRRRRSPLTLKANVDALPTFEQWLSERSLHASGLSLLACERYFDELLATHAVATVRRHLSIVRAAYSYALRHELVRRDPTSEVKLPRLPEQEPATYTNEELRAIYAAIRDEREQLIFFLFAFAGLRLCEAAALSWERIDFGNEQIKLSGKGGKFRLVPLHPALEHILCEQQPRSRQQQVVGSIHGSALAHRTWVAAVRALVDRAGVGIQGPSHAFRRTVATEMHEHGVRTSVIDKIMGWAPRTTRDRHYIRIATRAMREAILTLYRDDPVCPEQHQSAPRPDEREPESMPTFLSKEAARLAELERELALAARPYGG